MTALTQRFYLNMTNLADAAIAADESSAIGGDTHTGSAVHSRRNGVLAILACPEIILSQYKATNTVSSKAGDVEAFFGRSDQSSASSLNVWHITDDAALRVDET